MNEMNELMEQVQLESRNNEKGATMVEYALMVALIAVVCILAVTGIGTAARTAFNTIGTALTAAT